MYLMMLVRKPIVFLKPLFWKKRSRFMDWVFYKTGKCRSGTKRRGWYRTTHGTLFPFFNLLKDMGYIGTIIRQPILMISRTAPLSFPKSENVLTIISCTGEMQMVLLPA